MIRTDTCMTRGGLILVSIMYVMSLQAQNGNVGIGTTSPDTTLHVVGKVKIEDGSQQQGRILTADSTGLASWRSVEATGLLGRLPEFGGQLCLKRTGSEEIAGASIPRSIQVVGSYAYLVDQNLEEFYVFDIQNPSDPELIGSVMIGGDPLEVLVNGDYAYVVDQISDDLKVIDITDPSTPVIAVSEPLGPRPMSLDIRGNYLYVADRDAADLKVIDVSDPLNPAIVDTLAIGTSPGRVRIQGDYLYLLDIADDDMKIVDISTPTNPSLTSSIPLGNAPTFLDVLGDHAYVGDEQDNDLTVVNISNAGSPVVADSLQFDDIGQIAVRDSLVYVLNDTKLVVCNAGDPANVTIQDELDLGTSPRSLDLQGAFAYIAESSLGDGLSVIQLYCLPAVAIDPLTGQLYEQSATWLQNGDNIYKANSGFVGIGTADPSANLHIAGDLRIADGSESAGFVLTSDSMGLASWQRLTAQGLLKTPVSTEDLCLYAVASKPFGSDPREIQVEGQYAYVLDPSLDSLFVLDISTPTDPVTMGQVRVGSGTAQGMYVSGDYAYVVGILEGLKVFDISNPDNPTEVGSEGLGAVPNPHDVFVLGDYAYVVDNGFTDNFKVIDVSDPLNPSTDGTLSLGSPTAVYVQGSYAYVVDNGTNELRIIDVSNPASPSEDGSEPIGTSPVDIVVKGDYAYVIDSGSDDLKVIDVSSSAFPSIVASLPIDVLPVELEVVGTDAYVLDESSTVLRVIDISNPATPVVRADIAIGSAPVSLSVADKYVYTIDYANDEVSVINTICEPNISVDPISGDLVASGPSAWVWTSSNIFNVNGGNVGIGTSTPSENLVVGDDFGTDLVGTRLTVGDLDGTSGVNIGENIDNRAWVLWNRLDNKLELGTRALGVQYSGTLVLRDGKVGVGEENPETNMHIAGGNWNVASTEGDFKIGSSTHRLAMGIAVDGGGAGDARIFAKGGTEKLILGAGSTSVMYVRANGRVGIGVSSPNVELDVDGSIEYTGTITDVSDRRLKENFMEVQGTLEKLAALQAYSYNMRGDAYKKREYGLIAQDVQQVFPEIVTVVDEDSGYLGVSYIQLVPILVEAIKEQQVIIDAQSVQLVELSTLQEKLNTMEERMAKYESVLSEEFTR